jgi:phospholipid/cholesterol/gamma-HCH transport system substrate-binding protein
MPRTRSLAYSELKIGILAVVALIVASTVIFLLTGQGGFPWQRYHLKTRFDNVAGLKPGAPVRLAGIEVGAVQDIQLDGDRVEVVFEVLRAFHAQLTEQSRASLGSISLLGQATVDLTAATTGTPLREWSYVKSGKIPALADVTASANEGLQQATKLLADIRAGKGVVGKLFTDDTLYKELQAFVSAADEVAANVNRGGGTVGKLIKDPSAYQQLDASLRNLRSITDRINAGEGGLGRLLKDDAFAQSVTSTAGNLNTLTAGINRGEGTAGRFVKDPALYDRLNSMASKLDQLTGRLNEGQGTAGQLLHDKQLYDNMNAAVTDLRSLVEAIRKDPRKYLNVKVSLF